jgi:hypothetical protein
MNVSRALLPFALDLARGRRWPMRERGLTDRDIATAIATEKRHFEQTSTCASLDGRLRVGAGER